jgi:phosphatidylglycerophosphate synthase
VEQGPVERAEYFRRWAALHGGYDPTGTAVTGRWLGLVYRLAAPLARRRVSPSGLTLLGVVVSVAVPLVALLGDRWVLLAIPVVVLGGVLDNLDGAVAVLTGRASRFGYVLDSTADRVSDAAYALALWPLGAPAWLCALAAGLAWLPEYVRARAAAAGMTDLEILTVWERPTRIILTALLLLGAGVLAGHPGAVAVAGAVAWSALGAVAVGQLLVIARRRLGFEQVFGANPPTDVT